MAKIYSFGNNNMLDEKIKDISNSSEVLDVEGEHFVCTCVLSNLSKQDAEFAEVGYTMVNQNEGMVSVSLHEIDEQDHSPLPIAYSLIPPWVALKMASQLMNAAYMAMDHNTEMCGV